MAFSIAHLHILKMSCSAGLKHTQTLRTFSFSSCLIHIYLIIFISLFSPRCITTICPILNSLSASLLLPYEVLFVLMIWFEMPSMPLFTGALLETLEAACYEIAIPACVCYQIFSSIRVTIHSYLHDSLSAEWIE